MLTPPLQLLPDTLPREKLRSFVWPLLPRAIVTVTPLTV